eukprot:CAMPEP_0197515704 /NCGR_PEP_ID=MMETSP1318-20131121/755_1 /TAXON_ID=552666 /ORGANISM="Partenskyella glossopodia, Strain RCC365" /LENGTH=341 /DNA_ID=CAMNT_0043064151 /DNA_START=294 /DNA_END=1319 /DNA_ORIENTATION=-
MTKMNTNTKLLVMVVLVASPTLTLALQDKANKAHNHTIIAAAITATGTATQPTTTRTTTTTTTTTPMKFERVEPVDKLTLASVSSSSLARADPHSKQGSHKDGEATPKWAFVVQSFAVAVFFGGIVLHFYKQWSLAVLCFCGAFLLDVLVALTAVWTGHQNDFPYEAYRTFSLLFYRTVLIALVILEVSNCNRIFLGVWNFFDICGTSLMFIACDALNSVSYENSKAHTINVLTFTYSHSAVRFALEYGTMFFLLSTYELTAKYQGGPKGAGGSGEYSYSGIGAPAGGGNRNVYGTLVGVLLVVTAISFVFFVWAGLNNLLLTVEGIGFFTGPWKNTVCHV